MLLKENEKKETQTLTADKLPEDRNDPFVYFANVINGKIQVGHYDLSSPMNNEIVMKILEAAKYSAKTGKTVVWNQYFKE